MATRDDPMEVSVGSMDIDPEGAATGVTLRQGAYRWLSNKFYPLYAALFDEESYFIRRFEDNLAAANINQTAATYISATIGLSVVLGFTLGVLSGAFLAFAPFFDVAAFLESTLPDLPLGPLSLSNPVYAGVSILLSGTVLGIFVWTLPIVVARYMYVKSRKRTRSRRIKVVMPDLVSFIYSLSVGNMNELDIINAVADSEETYGEAAEEFKRIRAQIAYHNNNYRRAIENVARTTPNDDLQRFLVDMLKTLNTGGDVAQFLEEQKEEQIAESRRENDRLLDTLDTFGQMYMTIAIVPLLAIVIMVVMSFVGRDMLAAITVTVVAGIPFLSLAYIVLVSTIKPEQVSQGRIEPSNSNETITTRSSWFDVPVIEIARENSPALIGPILKREVRQRRSEAIKNPGKFFRDEPHWALVFFGLPLVLAYFAIGIGGGLLSFDVDFITAHSFSQTVLWFHVPVILALFFPMYYYELGRRDERLVVDTLTTDLRKLANTNQQGIPIREAMAATAQTNATRLGEEFSEIYKKTQGNKTLDAAITEMTNKYLNDRLARTMKLVQKAQESSSQISEVLQTAANLSQVQDDLDSERKTRTQMQLVVVAFTLLVFAVVLLALDIMFLDFFSVSTGSGGGEAAASGSPAGSAFGGGSIDPNVLSTLFFLAVTIQSIMSGAVSGYLQTTNMLDAVKYILAYMIITGVVWGVATGLFG